MSVESELREEALQRAGGRCEFPGGCWVPRPRLEMAHIEPKQMGGSRYRNVLDNVAMLCAEVHHPWLDGVIMQKGSRRQENIQLLRFGLDRQWKDRR